MADMPRKDQPSKGKLPFFRSNLQLADPRNRFWAIPMTRQPSLPNFSYAV